MVNILNFLPLLIIYMYYMYTLPWNWFPLVTYKPFTGVSVKQMFWFVFVLFNLQVHNFSVILGWSHCFLGIYKYFGNLKVTCLRTLYGGSRVRTLDLSLWSPLIQCVYRFPVLSSSGSRDFEVQTIRQR